MALHVALTHETAYRYDRRIGMGPQVVRLRPAPHCRTPILSYSLTIEPKTALRQLAAGPVRQFPGPRRASRGDATSSPSPSISSPTWRSSIRSTSSSRRAPKDCPFAYDPTLDEGARPLSRAASRPGRSSSNTSPSIDRRAKTTIDFLCDLNRGSQTEIRYLIRMEPGVQTPEETLRDAVGLVPRQRLAAGADPAPPRARRPLRVRLPDPAAARREAARRARRGATTDFTDLHAWTEVYVPGAGWIGLDPTSGLLAGEGHIPLAATPHPSSAAPITGSARRGRGRRSRSRWASTRIRETPRVTKPYSDETWQAIVDGRPRGRRASGSRRCAPQHGRRADVRLRRRHGGRRVEHGRRRAHQAALCRESRPPPASSRFAPGGLLHYGQGKWYPGEQLPRWAFALYWRADGEPLWEDPQPDRARGRRARRRRSTTPRRFMQRAVPPARIAGRQRHRRPTRTRRTSCWSSRSCRSTSTLENNKLDDPAERERLVRVFDRGLDDAGRLRAADPGAGTPRDRGRRWVTERWALRRDKLFLVPGDSPAGFRLPLAVAAGAAGDVDYPARFAARSVADGASPLPERMELVQRRRTVALEAPPLPAGGADERFGSGAHGTDGRAARRPSVRVHAAARRRRGLRGADRRHRGDRRKRPGCRPHRGLHAARPIPRLNVIKVTPDPGVIEVNVHPAATWDEAVDITTALYEEAHQARLGTEKFMLDGRHTGTGGGNHIVLGGIDAGRQPVPAPPRPARLASSPIGRTTRRCPTCSPACSSGRPARRRASTRRATRRSTSWRSRSSQMPDPGAGTCRRGSSTACSAICWSTSPATRIAPRSASTSSIRRTGRRAGSASSSSAPSRCRRTRA